tara:strand:- start:1542 stop:1757 length:216 start_codon:yes stop_codon:yes gene_type:complete
MSIYNYSKEEIIDRLQLVEYCRDELRSTLSKIQHIFKVKWPVGVDTETLTDEEYGDYVYMKLEEFVSLLES